MVVLYIRVSPVRLTSSQSSGLMSAEICTCPLPACKSLLRIIVAIWNSTGIDDKPAQTICFLFCFFVYSHHCIEFMQKWQHIVSHISVRTGNNGKIFKCTHLFTIHKSSADGTEPPSSNPVKNYDVLKQWRVITALRHLSVLLMDSPVWDALESLWRDASFLNLRQVCSMQVQGQRHA